MNPYRTQRDQYGPILDHECNYITEPKLTPKQREVIIAWLRSTFKDSDKKFQIGTYGIKHWFEKAPGGFYLRNGEFTYMMLEAGFQLSPEQRRHPRPTYHFKVKTREPLRRDRNSEW